MAFKKQFQKEDFIKALSSEWKNQRNKTYSLHFDSHRIGTKNVNINWE